MEYLCPRLEARFRQTGHARPIQFREYDCYADFVSLGKHVPKEKLRDCLDLIQILISEQFVFELCMPEGRLQYLLPADRRVFRRLAECDAIYAQLYALVDSGENGVLRYGKHFYEKFIPSGTSCSSSCGKEPAGGPERSGLSHEAIDRTYGNK